MNGPAILYQTEVKQATKERRTESLEALDSPLVLTQLMEVLINRAFPPTWSGWDPWE